MEQTKCEVEDTEERGDLWSRTGSGPKQVRCEQRAEHGLEWESQLAHTAVQVERSGWLTEMPL